MRVLNGSRVRWGFALALWIIVACGLTLFAQTAAENPGLHVTRSLSTAYALPESTFQVTLELKADADLSGVGIQERLPFGWAIHPVENAGAAFKRSEAEWVFNETLETGSKRVIVYELTLPAASQLMTDPLPQCFTISGTYQTTVPSFEAPIEGESDIEVGSELPIGTAIAHLIPRQTASADVLDLRLSRWITEAQLLRALELWQHDLPVPETGGQRIDLAMMNHLAAQFETCTRADDALPLSIDPQLHAVRTLDTHLPCDSVLLPEGCLDPGRDARLITVTLQITPSYDAYGIGLKEWFPSAWKATPIEHTGFWYRPSASEWVYPARVKAGETLKLTYQIEVVPTLFDPVEADAGCCGQETVIIGEVSAALECSVAPVLGEDTVTVNACIPVLLAISRWDVSNDKLDVKLSDAISFAQVQKAVQFWEQSLPVPHTCGYTVGYHALKTIVAYWLSETPITMPLSQDGALPACGNTLDDCESALCIEGWICQLADMQNPDDFVGLPKPPTVIVDGGPDRILTCAQPAVTLTAITTGGIEPFKYEWRDAGGAILGTERTLTTSDPGTYTLIAISCGGCLAIDTIDIIEDFGQPVVTASVSDVLTGYVTSVALSATVSQGTGPFAIVWTNPQGEPIGNALTVDVSEPGLYVVTATGSNGCHAMASIPVLQDIEPPVVQVDITPDLIVTAGPADATLTCAVPEVTLIGQIAGGREPYTLQWTNSLETVLGDTATLSVSMPEMYTLTVTGANGISASASVAVDQDIEPPVVSLETSGELTCAVTEVLLSVSVAGGRAPFAIQWLYEGAVLAGTDSQRTVSHPGNYTVQVTGSNGCSASANLVVEQNIEPPVVTLSANGILTCAITEVMVEAQVSGGRAPYAITWRTDSGEILGDGISISVSSPGVYTADVVGENGCSTKVSLTIEADIEPPVVTASVDGLLTCSTPSVNLHANVVGGRSPLTFKWTNESGQTIGTSVGLSVTTSGIYTVQVTGANGCTSIDRIIVDEDKAPPVVAASVNGPLTCAVDEVLLTSTVSGGRAPYAYEWTNAGGEVLGQTSTLAVSEAGVYTLTTIGANGCEAEVDVTVVQDFEAPVLSVPVPGPLTCALTEVELTVIVTGGRTPYTYLWTDASGHTLGQAATAIVSEPGDYTVEVTGGNGCSTHVTTTVSEDIAPPIVAIAVPDVLNCATTEVTLTAAAACGRAPYTYSWINSSGQTVGTEAQLVVDAAGEYSVTVTGANGCKASVDVIVQQDIAPPVVTIAEPDQLTCSLYSVTLTPLVVGGQEPYVYAWSNEAGQVLASTSHLIVSEPGIYWLTVTGSNGCAASADVIVHQDIAPPVVTIDDPDLLTCSVCCVTLAAATTGGRAPYTYSWINSSGQTVGTEAQLVVDAAGEYSVTVTGANGCSASASISVEQDVAAPAVSIPAPSKLSCATSCVTLTSCVSGGRPPYCYAWSDESGLTVGTTATLVVSTAGTYTLAVTGANGCTSVAQATVSEDIAPPCVTMCELVTLTCAQPSVFVDVEICNGQAPFTYEWRDDCGLLIATTEDVTLGFAGIYTVTVTGANGCSTTRQLEVVNGINPPIVDAGPDQILACAGDEVLLDATVSGGSLPYTYIWVDSCGDIVGACEDLVVTLPGTYILTVQSADGCVAMDDVIVNLP